MATPNTPAFITQIVDQCIDYTGDIFDRGITVDPTPQLSGRAPANSPVYIYDGGKLIGSAKADGSGNWSFTPDRELGTGLHALTVMAHGKMSEPLIITVEASGASTGRPVITSVVDNQGDSGQVEHGATISDKSPPCPALQPLTPMSRFFPAVGPLALSRPMPKATGASPRRCQKG